MNWVKFNILVGIYQLWIRLKPYLRILSLAKNNIGAEQLLTEIAAIDCRFSGLMGYMRTEGKNIPMLQAPARKTTHTLQTPPTLQSAQTLQKTQRLTFGYSTTANQSPVEWVR